MVAERPARVHPNGDEDLETFKDMMTINVFDGVKDGEALGRLANGVLGGCQKNSHIIRTHANPRPEGSEAEHYVAAVLQAPNVREVAFARMLQAAASSPSTRSGSTARGIRPKTQ